MLLTNRLSFFDKKGNEINLNPDSAITVTVVDPTNSGGYGAQFEVFTDRDGHIEALYIVDGGANYDITGQAYLRFVNVLSGYTWDTNPADLSVDPVTGEIQNFFGLATPPSSGNWADGNAGFPYPAVTWKGEMYFDRVSVGLIENQDVFILEKVLRASNASLDDIKYVFPRADEGPSFTVGSYKNVKATPSPGVTITDGVGSVSVLVYSYTGNLTAGQTKIYGLISTANLKVGMAVEGTGIPAGTRITSIVSSSVVEISKKITSNLVAGTVEFYKPHGFVGGMRIRIGDPALPLQILGSYDVTHVSDRTIYFSTPSTLGNIPSTAAPSTMYFRALPVWRARLVGQEEEIFLFNVAFNEDYPVITRVGSDTRIPTDGDNLTIPDLYYEGGQTIWSGSGKYMYRRISENFEERMMQFHLGFSAGTEGSYIRLLVLEDITFPYAPALIAQVSLRGEAVSEDVRLRRLLENFGRDVTEQQELILRDSDVNEDLPNYILLNQKRKEMLLQGDQIWPYLGSYKGVVNIINWFGYYDMRIKEYWLNVNKNDVYYGKYKQVQIPFQLENRGVPYTSIEMMPSKVYKKTNKFGLFYDLNKESGVLDENGVPVTIDAFQFSNEEILIKLFALKQYLLNTFLPLNAKIVDIVGEGVYFERYAANTWNDRVEQLVVELTRNVDFAADSTYIPLEDARKFNAAEVAYVYSPGTDTLQSYYSTYTITGVNVIAPYATVSGFPLLSISTASGNASPTRLWEGQALLRGLPGVYTLGVLSSGGIGYTVGDVITLSGGTFSAPLRVKVLGVIPGGSITQIEILSGFNQGTAYRSLPDAFSQLFVISEDLLSNKYFAGTGTGFQLYNSDINYEFYAVKTTTQGKGYPIEPLSLLAINPLTGASIPVNVSVDTKTVQGPYVGYFNESKQLLPLTNEPNVPVGAFLDLSVLGLEAYWNDMIFSWSDLWGASDASIKAYVDPLPGGTGSITGLEILDPGSGYTQFNLPAPDIVQFTGGEGQGAVAGVRLKDGKLQLLDIEITSAVVTGPSTTRFFVATPFPVAPIYIGTSVMVTGADSSGAEIPKPALVIARDTVGGTWFDVNVAFASAPGNFNVLIHNGIELSLAVGTGYVSAPDVKIRGGHTGSLYTWDEIGRGNFIELEWKITSEPGTTTFNYSSGRLRIDVAINHTVQLPYKGFYKVELIAYDTENNWVNEIKREYVEVFMPEATPIMAARFIGPSYTPGAPVGDGGTGSEANIKQLETNCVDTWDEGYFRWDEYWGRWVNPIKTWTTWTDCDIEWDTLAVTPLSKENNWNYPIAPSYEVYRVSAYDNLVGSVNLFDPTVPLIRVTLENGNNDLPEVQPGEWIYIRRDSLVFQVEVVAVSSSAPTSMQYDFAPGSVWPENFEANPTAWDVLREVENTVVVQDDLYTPGNGKTLNIGQFITLSGNNNTPLNNSRWNLLNPPVTWGVPILAKLPDPLIVADGGIEIDAVYSSNSFMMRDWVNGQIYQYRNITQPNGSLDLFCPTSTYTPRTVFLERLVSPTEENWGNRGMFYINNIPTNPLRTTADPLEEIRPGFTIIELLIGKPDLSSTSSWLFYKETVEPQGGTVQVPSPMLFNPTNQNVLAGLSTGIDGLVFTEVDADPLASSWSSFFTTAWQPGYPAPTVWRKGTAIHVPSTNTVWVASPNAAGTGCDVQIYNASTGAFVTQFALQDGSGASTCTEAVMVYDSLNDLVWTAGSKNALGSFDPGLCAMDPVALTVAYSVPSTLAEVGCGGMVFDPIENRIWMVRAGGPGPITGRGVVCVNVDVAVGPIGTILLAQIMNSGPEALCGNFIAICNTSAGRILAGNISNMTTCFGFSSPGAGYIGPVNIDPVYGGVGGVKMRGIEYHPQDNQFWIYSNAYSSDTLIPAGVSSNVFVNIFDAATYQVTRRINGQSVIPSTVNIIDTAGILYVPDDNLMLISANYDDGVDPYLGLFTMNGVAYDFTVGETLYQQHFRTIDMYEDNSNEGHPWDIWSDSTGTGIVCIEVATLDGKKFDEIYEKLATVDFINTFAWIEYKYNAFPTRTYKSNAGANTEITMDFNTKPILGAFANSTFFPADTPTGRGWYYDHGISEGDFSLEVTNVGRFEEVPGYTIVTVADPNSELYRCDSTFREKARDFDEDYAETHLGVKLAWSELFNIDWNAMCSQTWATTDWPYTLFNNFRLGGSDYSPSNYHLTFNEGKPLNLFDIASPISGNPAKDYPIIVSMLNNNFFEQLPSIPASSFYQRNDHPDFSKFFYNLEAYPTPLNPTPMVKGIFSWGDPTLPTLFGDTTGIGVTYSAYGTGIQPGWAVTVVAPGTVNLNAGSYAGPTQSWPAPFIPACEIHADLVAGSRELRNISGYLANLPQAGYIYDDATVTVIGQFGPGKGKIVEENGFVTFIEMDTPSAITDTNRYLLVFPYRTGEVKFFDPAPSTVESLVITAAAKSPGADTIGYITSPQYGGSLRILHNHEYIGPAGIPAAPPSNSQVWGHTYPLGNYYNWVQDLDIFYGGGLENSLLQFSQPYRNIQSYILGGGEQDYFGGNADGGGWYPSHTWRPYVFPTGIDKATAQVVDTVFPGITKRSIYKPSVYVSLYDSSGAQIATTGNVLLNLNTWYDGSAQLLYDSAGSPVDFTALIPNPYGATIYVKILEEGTTEEGQEFQCVVVHPQFGLLGRNVFYFTAFHNTDPSLVYNYPSYQLISLTPDILPGGPYFTSLQIFPGMALGNLTLTNVSPVFVDDYSTKVTEWDSENSILSISSPHLLGNGFTNNFYAYTPLNLNIKVQPTNEKIWSATKQADSMVLQYEGGSNGAFTWEDTTLSIREKKIPAGTSVLFSSDASDIAGKTGFLWNLFHDGVKVCSVIDPNFLWTFLEPGLYDLELVITDTNGNKQSKYLTDFVEVYLAERS